MDNFKLACTIYQFIKYCNKPADDQFHYYVPSHEGNLEFIQKWIDDVWSKEQL